ncbi:MAG: N-acetylmuramoyl-L-alanine amidase, partial [Thermoanaerobaculia bacterium]
MVLTLYQVREIAGSGLRSPPRSGGEPVRSGSLGNLIRRRRLLRLVTLLGLASALPAPLPGATLRVEIEDGKVAAQTDGQEIFLEAVPESGEGLLSFARRLTGTRTHAAAIARVNGGAERLLAGIRYRVPFDLLAADLQVRVVGALFADDRAVTAGWEHRIAARPHGRESLWHIADWFTGRGDNYRAIREANRLMDDDLAPGQVVIIPARLLRPGFRSALPPSSLYYLEYGSDRRGKFAIYRLEPGEALYSSVVVRFTGQVFAEDVSALAAEVARRSGIREVTEIPVGYEVKIPFELLLPEFLPAGHPRRREYEEELIASAQYSNLVQADRLQGVTVVLDAGHGGKDVGASMGGVWESLYVYDIMLRTRRLLEETTSAKVITTTQDGESRRPPDSDKLPYSNGHRVLTTPNYRIEDSTVGVHLRWYLVNSI